MTLSLINPMNKINRLGREFDNFIKQLENQDFQTNNCLDETVFSPKVNIAEDKDLYILNVDLPGMEKKDIKINLQNNLLSIDGERKQDKEDKDKEWIRREAFYGKFSRSFSLPKDVDPNKTKASFKNGILEIELVKKEEAKPREISINVN